MEAISRRKFLKKCMALAAAGCVAGPLLTCCTSSGRSSASKAVRVGNGPLRLSFRPVEHEMRHTFTIAGGISRDVCPSMLVEIEYDGVVGYGEGGLPPYMIGQTVETASRFLSKVDLSRFSDPFQVEDILAWVDSLDPGMTCAKSAVDIALHDLIGKLLGVPCYRLFGYTAERTPYTSYTIGIDTEEVIREKTLEAAPYRILKVKLGVDEATDKMLVRTIRSISDKPMVVDANQGWPDKHYALEMIHWLAEQGIQMVEQPLPKHNLDDMAWVTERSPLPTYADESCQRLADVARLHGVFNGINIKLIKCTGLHEARKMIAAAEALGMRLMIGCTTESSCALSAAAQIAPRMDFADLDGNLLIANDDFDGMKIIDGKITLNERPGIGAVPLG